MKPIVRECIQEVLLQEGVLSTIISEVIKGTSQTIVEQPRRQPEPPAMRATRDNMQEQIANRKRTVNQHRRKLMDAIGKDSYNGVNIFEGTEPIRKAGTPGENAATQGALSNYAPEDPGVDISGLLNLAGGSWKKID